MTRNVLPRDPESWGELWRRIRGRPSALLCSSLLLATTAATLVLLGLIALSLVTWWQLLLAGYGAVALSYAVRIVRGLHTQDWRKAYYRAHPRVREMPDDLRRLVFLLDLIGVATIISATWPYYISRRLRALLHRNHHHHHDGAPPS